MRQADSTLESLETQERMPTFSPKYRPDTRALSLVSAVVADPLGSESTVERMCEHMFEERSGLLYLLSAADPDLRLRMCSCFCEMGNGCACVNARAQHEYISIHS